MLARLVSIALFCVLLNTSFALAQEVAPSVGSPGQRTYPDTAQGLRDLMVNIVDATKTQLPSRKALIDSLILPADSTWFTNVFGPDQGGSLSTAYRNSLTAFEDYMQGLFRHCASEGLHDIQVERVDQGPAAGRGIGGRVAALMKQPTSLYRVSFRKDGREQASSQSYVFANGGFRHISDGVFAALPVVPQPRMRLGESAALGMLVHRVEPSLPKEVAGPPDGGRVILNVLIDTDGSVKEVSAKQGDPMLVQAAIQAVRQWKFRPFVLQGYPHLRPLRETEVTISFKGR